MSTVVYKELKRLDTLHSFRIIVECEMEITCWESGFIWIGKRKQPMSGGYTVQSPSYNFRIQDQTPYFHLTYPLPEVKWDEQNIYTLIDKYDLWGKHVFLQDWKGQPKPFDTYGVRIEKYEFATKRN